MPLPLFASDSLPAIHSHCFICQPRYLSNGWSGVRVRIETMEGRPS